MDAQSNSLVGEYSLVGVMETASGFRLNPDSTFDFYFSYEIQLMMPLPKVSLMRMSVVGFWVLGGGLAYIIVARLVGAFYFSDLQKLLKNKS